MKPIRIKLDDKKIFKGLSIFYRAYASMFFAFMLHSMLNSDYYMFAFYAVCYVPWIISSMILMRKKCINLEDSYTVHFEDMLDLKKQLFATMMPIVNISFTIGILKKNTGIVELIIDVAHDKYNYSGEYYKRLKRVKEKIMKEQYTEIHKIACEAEEKFIEFNNRAKLVDEYDIKYIDCKTQFMTQYISEKYGDDVYRIYINYTLDSR